MWALRRTARHLKLPCGNGKGAGRASANLLEIRSKCNAVESSNRINGEGFAEEGHIIARRIFYGASHKLVQVGCGFNFTSLAGEKKEDNKIEGKDDDCMFSEPDVALEEDTLASQSQAAEEARADPYLSEKGKIVKLTKLLRGCDDLSVLARLDTWVEEGNLLTRKEFRIIIRNLSKRRMYGQALQVCQSFLAKGSFQLNEIEYSICLGLVTRVHGIGKAQEYFETIPLKMRGGCRVYRTLLQHCAFTGNIEKTEEIVKKMKDAGFSPNVTVYNKILSHFILNSEKFSSILEVMEHANVKPNAFTYVILIDWKGRAGDIVGMEQIVNKMKEDGIETNYMILSTLANHYAHVGNMKNVELLIKELEKNYMNERRALRLLLPLYAVVGKDNEIEKVWNIFETSNRIYIYELIAVIQAWGKLGNIEKAEIIFDKSLSSRKRGSLRVYNALLDVYVNHNLSNKGVELVKQMLSKGITVDPVTCDSLVKLFVKSGDTEKAGAFLIKVCTRKQVKPQYRSFSMVLEEYAKRGDIANAEKIFDCLTSIGYNYQLQSYEFLLQAYIKAQIPAYGFKERMLAAKLYPSGRIDNLLQKVEALKEDGFKNYISD